MVGQEGKPESYYFPPQHNNVGNNFPYTFMGLEPGTTKDDVRQCLERWNQGLKEGGPIGMLLASLFVCALYMMWVLALSELSVAMPFAGGPLAYGRRAVGPATGESDGVL